MSEKLTQSEISQMVKELTDTAEVARRTEAKRRHDLYKDDGNKFLIEQITREFGVASLPEMRLAPLNIMKKIVNKRSVVYRTPPVRKANSKENQNLVDFYVKELDINTARQKTNRFYNLHSNTVIYVWPGQKYSDGKEFMKLNVIPPYLYGIKPNAADRTVIDAFIFNAFLEESQVAPRQDLPSATGSGYNREKGTREPGRLTDAEQDRNPAEKREFILWSASQHLTFDGSGAPISISGETEEQNKDLFLNPIDILPIVNVTKERDAEPWSKVGTDLFNNCLAFAVGWSDLLTIAKHQGFSVPVIISEEEPKNVVIGTNKVIWLKTKEGSPPPSFSYAQASSPLSEYKDVLMEFLGLILTSNDLNPGAVSGSKQTQEVMSGFSRLIEMSDALEAIESDKPVMRKAEEELWHVIKAWHNDMYDRQVLRDDAAALGKFSDDCTVGIQYRDIKPIESQKERLEAAKLMLDMGLSTKKMAVKQIEPELTDEEADKRVAEIKAEHKANAKEMGLGGEDEPVEPEVPNGEES